MVEWFEDLSLGMRFKGETVQISEDDIKQFAAKYDPQPFHLDEAAAAQSLFGALCASGWHTACLWMRLAVEYRHREDDERRARGEPVAALGVSPGFRELRWLSPVYPGDTITYATEIVELRPSASRPEWGIMTARNTGTNQRGEPVLSFISS